MFYFEVERYNGSNFMQDAGLIDAENYQDALKKMVDRYNDELASVFLEEWDDIVTESDIKETFLTKKGD